jgi:membrane fusion protein, multidrug efflux system
MRLIGHLMGRPRGVASHLAHLVVAGGLLALFTLGAAAASRVPVAEARIAAVGVGFELEGSLQAVRQATVAAQASGQVLQLHVKAGDAVRAGQRLVSVDAREAQAQVARSEAELAQAGAQLANAQAQLERTRSLRAQGFVSQAALDVAQAQHDAATAAHAATRAGRAQTGLARSFAEVTAPFDGVVAQTWVEAGDLALPGKPLVLLYAPGAVRAVVQVPSSRQALARQASHMEVRLPDGRWVRPLRVSGLPTLDPLSQTAEWRLDLDATDVARSSAQPGQPVRVRFVGSQAQALVVPHEAVLRRGELTAVYVQGSGQGFVLRAVRLGTRQGAAGIEVVAGLAAGERVALDPVAAGMAPAPSGAPNAPAGR